MKPPHPQSVWHFIARRFATVAGVPTMTIDIPFATIVGALMILVGEWLMRSHTQAEINAARAANTVTEQ